MRGLHSGREANVDVLNSYGRGRLLRQCVICGCLGVFVFLSGAGCKKYSSESPLMREVEGVDVTSFELRSRMSNFAHRFSGLVEETADRIIAQSDDPDIQQNARLWKIHAIPACQKAIFFSDPLVALIDAWMFCIQMRLYFTGGAGEGLFGEWQSLAVETSERLEADMAALHAR